MKLIFLIVIFCGLTFPSVRITLAALLEGSSDYLYESARREKSFIPYWLKKVRNDYHLLRTVNIVGIGSSGSFG